MLISGLDNWLDENGNPLWRPQGLCALAVPDTVEIEIAGDADGNQVEHIRYAIPEWFGPIPLTTMKYISFLEGDGWKVREDVRGLLDDFIQIGNGSTSQVVRFVQKWGPLWLCSRHEQCLWTPCDWMVTQASKWDCLWPAVERVDDFRVLSRHAGAMLDIAAHLRDEGSAPPKLWRKLAERNPLYVVNVAFVLEQDHLNHSYAFRQHFELARVLRQNLLRPGGPGLDVSMGEDDQPALRLMIGTGFIRAVWVQIAQVITGAVGVYLCSGCGHAYIRHDRKPKRGGRNYCPSCGTLAAKRDWARRNKAESDAS